MANASIPLQARAPQIDVAAIEAAAQNARANDQSSQLNAFKIQQAPAEMAYANDEMAFNRKKMDASGAELDANKAAGYPNMRKKLFDVFQGLTPEQYQGAVMKQRQMREAYNYIMSFPQGSPERQQAFTTKLQELHKAGVVDDMTARAAVKSGASDLAMENVRRQLDMLEEFTAGPTKAMTPLQQSQIDVNTARAGYLKGGGAAAKPVDPAIMTNRVGTMVKDLASRLMLDQELFMSKGRTDPTVAKALEDFEKGKQLIYQRFGMDENGLPVQGGAPTATPGTGIPGSTEVEGLGGADGADEGDGSEDSPFTPIGPEDMQGIPDGAYYVNPSDGELYVKDSSAGDLG